MFSLPNVIHLHLFQSSLCLEKYAFSLSDTPLPGPPQDICSIRLLVFIIKFSLVCLALWTLLVLRKKAVFLLFLTVCTYGRSTAATP